MRFGIKVLPHYGDRVTVTKYAYFPTRVYIGKKPNTREERRALVWVWLETYQVEKRFRYSDWETMDSYVE